MTRRTIAIVVEDTASDGTGRFVLDLCRFAASPELRLDVIALARAGALAIPMQHEGVAVHTLDLPEARGARRAWWSFAGALQLFTMFRKLRPEIVHGVGLRADVLARIAARQARVPWVLSTLRREEAAGGPLELAARATASLVDVHVAASATLGRAAVSRQGAHPARVRVIPPGVSPGALAGEAPHPVLQGRPVIGTLSRLVFDKGIDTLVDATAILARYHPGVRVLVGGVGADALRFVRCSQRAELAERILFAGELDNPGAALAAMDVFVLPSRREGAPVAILEALAAGIPVVATAIPGVLDLVEPDVHALLVPPDKPALIADAVDRVLTDAALRARLVAAGRALVHERHRAADMAAAYEQLWARLLGVRLARPAPMAV